MWRVNISALLNTLIGNACTKGVHVMFAFIVFKLTR